MKRCEERRTSDISFSLSLYMHYTTFFLESVLSTTMINVMFTNRNRIREAPIRKKRFWYDEKKRKYVKSSRVQSVSDC